MTRRRRRPDIPWKKRRSIKQRLIARSGGKCEKCGAKECSVKVRDKSGKLVTDKHGNPRFRSSLEMHHINGNHFDNDLSNLTIICIDCHNALHPDRR